MDFPEDIWKIIKNYLFDYQKYWKHIFNQNILSKKILNTNRDIFWDIWKLKEPTSIRSVELSYQQKNSYAYYRQNRSISYNKGWIYFTTNKKKKERQEKLIERFINYNKFRTSQFYDSDIDYFSEHDQSFEYDEEICWGMFDTDDY
mgnify:CR=1 FL=1